MRMLSHLPRLIHVVESTKKQQTDGFQHRNKEDLEILIKAISLGFLDYYRASIYYLFL